jgi:prepilin-type N-terminal cleavage/methylation domain-containing protein
MTRIPSRASRAGLRRRAASRRHPRAGLTLVELLVAMMILTIGLLGLASIAAVSAKLVRGGATQTVAASIAQSRFDLLTSARCSAIANQPRVVGTATTRGIRERWVVDDGNDVVYVTDTVRVPGRAAPLVYLSVIPCRD